MGLAIFKNLLGVLHFRSQYAKGEDKGAPIDFPD